MLLQSIFIKYSLEISTTETWGSESTMKDFFCTSYTKGIICDHDHIWPGGGGVESDGWWSHPLRIFLPCSNYSLTALQSPKTTLKFTPNSQFHTYFNIFEPFDFASHLLLVVICVLFLFLATNFTEIVARFTWPSKR